MNTFTTFVHVVFISAWLENELRWAPKIYIWSETFLSCSYAVNFVHRTFNQPENLWGPWLLCRSGKWICSWPKHPYSSKSQRMWGQAQRAVKEKTVQAKQIFSVQLIKSRNLSIPSQSVSVWDRPPVTQDLVPHLMMENQSLENSIKLKKKKPTKQEKGITSSNWAPRKGKYLTYCMSTGCLFITSIYVWYFNVSMKKWTTVFREYEKMHKDKYFSYFTYWTKVKEK